jgi:hypothetical protein
MRLARDTAIVSITMKLKGDVDRNLTQTPDPETIHHKPLLSPVEQTLNAARVLVLWEFNLYSYHGSELKKE